MKVMVVDDSTLLKEWMRREITKINKSVVIEEAQDCAEAKRVFSDFRPDTVVLDISLPDGSGINLIPEFRKKSPGTKIVMLSNNSEKMIINKCLSLGADSYFNKAELREFLDHIKDIC